MTVVYVDRVFFLNTALDYLLLLATARLSGAALRRLRFLLCAACGGGYAVLAFLPSCHFLAHPVVRLAAGIAMALAALAGERHIRRLILLFFLLSGALAGLVLALGLVSGSPGLLFSRMYYAEISWPMLIFSAIFFDLLLHLVFRQGMRHGGGELMDVTVSIGGTEQSLRVLHDTGNTLRDPVSGQPVLVVERDALRRFWNSEEMAILSGHAPPEEKLARLYRQGTHYHFSLLPFHSVGVSGGLLLAVRSDYIAIGQKNYPRTLIALSDSAISDGGGYHGLWGVDERRTDSHVQTMVAEDPAMVSVQNIG